MMKYLLGYDIFHFLKYQPCRYKPWQRPSQPKKDVGINVGLGLLVMSVETKGQPCLNLEACSLVHNHHHCFIAATLLSFDSQH